MILVRVDDPHSVAQIFLRWPLLGSVDLRAAACRRHCRLVWRNSAAACFVSCRSPSAQVWGRPTRSRLQWGGLKGEGFLGKLGGFERTLWRPARPDVFGALGSGGRKPGTDFRFDLATVQKNTYVIIDS